MRVLALTGGIASGKSTVAEALERHGAEILDADRIAREVVEPGTPTLAGLVAAFGPEVLDARGRLDRARLAARVFGDEPARQRLNALVHPAVIAEMNRQLAELARRVPPVPFVVLVVPLLFETGMEKLAERVWVVSVPEAEQKRRLMRRDALSTEAAQARIDSQMPLADKLARADVVIDNSGSSEEIEAAVEAALRAEGLLG